jgi:hypothetical protein
VFAVLIDADYGAATGQVRFAGSLTDQLGAVDAILSALPITAPAGDAGFGADVAVVSSGGRTITTAALSDDVGLRSLATPTDLIAGTVAIEFGEAVISGGEPLPVQAGEGMDVFIPWASLYPQGKTPVPAGATLAIAVVLASADGTTLSNQALPPYPTADSPGAQLTPLPGVVVFRVDANGDGIADGASPPTVR